MIFFDTKLKFWLLASRPKTLSAAATPVVVASALAFYYNKFSFYPAALCLIFAVVAQIVSNFANDYFDYKKGADNREERLGPKRAVTEGWIAPKTMLAATLILLIIDMAIGMLILSYSEWWLIFVGMAVALFAIAYSGGPYPLAYHGFGDICVIVFFGIVPVVFTFFVQTAQCNISAIFCGLAVGLVVANILIANNFRDRELDKRAKKNTLIVILGENFGKYFYLTNGILAAVLCQYFWVEHLWATPILPLVFLFFHIKTWRQMCKIFRGKGLIAVLESSSRNVLIFGALLSLGLIVDKYLGH